METAVILIRCPDRKGIVSKISTLLFGHDANILTSDQYSTDPEGGQFFVRVAFSFEGDAGFRTNLEADLEKLVGELCGAWEIHYADRVMRMGVLVSREDHCLVDVLYRQRSGELGVEIPLVISNHEHLRGVVEQQGIAFHYLPVSRETKREQERQVLALVKDATDFLVLARYMQILTADFLEGYGKDIINIHHSFLPLFAGANPYQQAYDRGVKLIGATAHYVTADLDEGPIIDQAVERVSHRDSVEAMKRKGRNLEKVTLANAIRAHVERRVLRYRNKTIVFD